MQSETLHLDPPLGSQQPHSFVFHFYFSLSDIELRVGEEISQNIRYEWLMGRLGVVVDCC